LHSFNTLKHPRKKRAKMASSPVSQRKRLRRMRENRSAAGIRRERGGII
jgi:hypothetical protein